MLLLTTNRWNFFIHLTQLYPVTGNRNNIWEKQQECEEEKAIAQYLIKSIKVIYFVKIL